MKTRILEFANYENTDSGISIIFPDRDRLIELFEYGEVYREKYNVAVEETMRLRFEHAGIFVEIFEPCILTC